MAKLRTLFTAAVLLGAVFGILADPAGAFRSSLAGLRLWWDVVFPAMFPFLTLAELLNAGGILKAAGAWFEPITRRMLGLPGIGAAVVWLGVSAGQPAAATLVAKLVDERRIDGRQAERLLAVSHLAHPVLIVSVVGANLFQDVRIGWLLAIVHYTTAIFTAVLFIRPTLKAEVPVARSPTDGPPSSFGARHAGRLQERPPSFGRLLGDAVASTVARLFAVGGWMMFFSVTVEMIRKAVSAAAEVASWRSGDEASVWIPVLFDHCLGAAAAAGADGPLRWQTAVASFALAWGGLSGHAQAFAMVAGRGVRYWPFSAVRAVHAVLSAATAFAVAGLVPIGTYPASPASTAGSQHVDRFRPNASDISVWSEIPDMLFASLITAALIATAALTARANFRPR